MKYAIIDTSSIVYGFSRKRNVFDAVARLRGHIPVIALAVVRELHGLATNKGKTGAAARTALQELRYKNIKVANRFSGDADSEILRMAKKHKGSVVISNDTALLKRILAARAAEVFKLNLSGRLVKTR